MTYTQFYTYFFTAILIFLVIIFFAIRKLVQGKILAFFVEKDKALKHRLFRPEGKFFKFKKEDEMYVIDPDCVMLVKYPFGMMIPDFIKQIVPCLIYAKGNPEPLSPANVSVVPKGMTAKQIASAVSEVVVKGIVQGVSEETKVSRFPSWFFPGITILLLVIMALMIYSVSAKVTVMQNSIQGLIK